MKTLFILKKSHHYHVPPNAVRCPVFSTGLYTSCRLIVDMLNANGREAALVVVNDNNDIDREVTQYKPDTVIIEALWVVPQKFEILMKLHPRVRWIVRIHSDLPFIAQEGIAMEWIYRYLDEGIEVASNKKELVDLFPAFLYLPNYYPVPAYVPILDKSDNSRLKVGCFGAIRPLKNQLVQALAALVCGRKLNRYLEFHINSGRIHPGGDPVFKNLVNLFRNSQDDGELIVHPWLEHDAFLTLVRTMDIGLQVSFSETFNVISADMVTQGVPVVMSKEIPWGAEKATLVQVTSAAAIARKMEKTLKRGQANVRANLRSLGRYSERSRRIWLASLA